MRRPSGPAGLPLTMRVGGAWLAGWRNGWVPWLPTICLELLRLQKLRHAVGML